MITANIATNEIMPANLLPGMVNKEVEFFAMSEDDIRCSHDGRTLRFDQFPLWVTDALQKHINEIGSDLTITEFILKNFAGVDHEADIYEDGKVGNYEYSAYSGRSLDIGKGKHLTESELGMLKIIFKPYKIIADELFISRETVSSHIQNIKSKLKLNSSSELAVFATMKGIINIKNFITCK